MKVFEIRLKIFLLQDIHISHIQTKIAAFLDKGFLKDEELAKFHEENKYKYYSHDYHFRWRRTRYIRKIKYIQ